ncbi:MAG: metallophosphoesterase family protein [Gaiellaceae bacterium]
MLRRGRKGPRTRIFFATDVHGSEQCFRKWLNAARVYEVDVLILGGDVAGKVVVPLVAGADGTWRGEIHGQAVAARSEEDLHALQKQIRTMGRYDVVLAPEEKQALDTEPERLEELFRGVMLESLERWIALADERLPELGVPAFMMLGNDDFPELADVIRGSQAVENAEDAVFELPGGYELLSNGYSTPTPWHTPREVSEEELDAQLRAAASGLREPEWAVFNVHCPPVDTHLDQAPKLDDELRPVVDAGGLQLVPVGSTAVRALIEEVQSVVGLHGHVHESPAVQSLGRTLCLNPGSEYGDGILRGAIVELDRERGVRRWQLTHG